MDLMDLDRLYWILIYRRDVMTTTMVSSTSSDWICLFRAFVGKMTSVITIYTEVICLILLSFDFD